MADRRGSVAIDDEGTPGQYNVLIENGILKGYMQDKLNARLMGVAPTNLVGADMCWGNKLSMIWLEKSSGDEDRKKTQSNWVHSENRYQDN